MWTRASSITSCVIDWDHEEEVGSGASSEEDRFHHRGSGSNHQPGDRDSRLLQDEESSEDSAAAALGEHIEALRRDDSLTIHHDLPNPPGACKLKKRSLPSSSRTGFLACSHSLRSSMSPPELSTRVRQPRQQSQSQSQSRGSRSLEESMICVSKDFQQLDDMQTQIGNETPAESSPDQEVPEVVLPSTSPSKRRRLVYCNEELNLQAPASGTRSCEEDSGLSSQHMADLDRASKASTPEDIDSEPPPAASELGLVPQCTTTTATTTTSTTTTPPGNLLNVAEQETTVVVEPLQILEHLHFSRHDDTPSQFLPHISRVLPPVSRISSTQTSSTMADEWLQLSLGKSYDEHNQQQRPATTSTTAPMQFPSPDPPGVRDFFSSEASSSHRQQQVSSSPYRPRPAYSGESSKQVGTVPRPLFLEPRPPRGVASEQFRGSFMPPQFSNLQYPPVRVLQPVRTEQSTETTAVHAWRSPYEAPGPSSHGYGAAAAAASSSSSAPWMREPAPNPGAEFLSMGTPRDYNYRMPPFSSMQQHPQGVDPEQAWRNLLQRVGNNMTVPVGTGFPARAPMLPPGDHSEEHMDALKRAVERFQGADQDPLTELQRLQRRGQQQQQQQAAGPSSYDPNTDISLASFYGGGGGSAAHGGPSSSSRPRAGAQPSAHRRIILRPHAPRPGLWFTLQASNSQPEASPLQQIPTAYIRVVDDTMTVAAVRRYLANKLGLASEDEVELACKGQLLQATLSLHQVRNGIWQSPNTNTTSPHPNTHQLLLEGKAWKAPDGSITLVGDVVMVLTYTRRPQQQQQQQSQEEEQALLPVTSS